MPSFFRQNHSFSIIKKIWFCLFVCSFYSSVSQTFYSTDPNYLRVKTDKNNLISNYKNAYPDTSINNFHNPFPRNFLGNIGLPSPTYQLNYGTADLGFNLYPTPYQNDIIKGNDVEYYRSKGPYANLTGIAGSKSFQAFKMLFTHTYKNKVNFTLRFNRYTSKGFYLNQQSYTNNFYFSSNYATKKGRFGYYFYVLTNSNKNKENGGIASDSLTETSLLQNKELFPTKITAAVRNNRETQIMLNPYFRLNRISDSSTKINHFIQLKSTTSFNSYQYTDNNVYYDKYYALTYLDTALSHDSTHVRKFSNEISYTAITTNSNLALSVGYKSEINQVWQKADSVIYNNMFVADAFYRKKFSSTDSLNKKENEFQTHFNFQYIFSGGNKNNYKAESKSVFILNKAKHRYLFLNLLAESRSADYVYNYWVSNNFEWFNNGYKPQQQRQLNLGFNLNRNLSASVFLQNITNYLFFDNVALPAQYSSSLNNIGFNLNFTKVFLRHLGVAVDYRFQNTTNITYIRLPQNQATAKLYYTGYLFKNNLQLQIGGQLQAYQSFYSYGYMPSTQAFYLQEGFKTSTYPFLDVYLNARIHPVSFFLKIENAFYGLAGAHYNFAPGYYQTDRAFRFGLSWTFFD